MTDKSKIIAIAVALCIVMLTVLSMLKFLGRQEVVTYGTDKAGKCVEITYKVPSYLLNAEQDNGEQVIKERGIKPYFIAPCLINETGNARLS